MNKINRGFIMGMYKSNLSPEQEKARSNVESVDAFLARGGQISKVADKKENKKLDPQKLLEAATACGQEREMIAFLESEGFKVV
jgi:hypothetical protein